MTSLPSTLTGISRPSRPVWSVMRTILPLTWTVPPSRMGWLGFSSASVIFVDDLTTPSVPSSLAAVQLCVPANSASTFRAPNSFGTL